jgi:hypothetical protein
MHVSRNTARMAAPALLLALACTACALDDDLADTDAEVEVEADQLDEELGTELLVDCDFIDVGLTVRSGNWIKGSGSFNNCGGLYSIEVAIQSGGSSWRTMTAAWRYPSPGQAYAFSAPDYLCTPGAQRSFVTRVQANRFGGQPPLVKYSNVLNTNCY